MFNPPSPFPQCKQRAWPICRTPPPCFFSPHTPYSPTSYPSHSKEKAEKECAPFDMPRAKVSNLDTLAPPALRLSSAALPSPGRTKALVPLPLVPGGSGPLQEGTVPFLSCQGYNYLAQDASGPTSPRVYFSAWGLPPAGWGRAAE